MLKKISYRILSSLPQILALLFIFAFAVYAWQEPSQSPPGGNVSPPVTLDTAQTITGLKTFNPSSGLIPFLVDAAKKGVVANLNSDKLDGYNAADLIAAVPSGPWTYLGKTPTNQGGAIGTLPQKGLEVLIAYDFGPCTIVSCDKPYSGDITCSVQWSTPIAPPTVKCSNGFTPLYYLSLDWTGSPDKKIPLFEVTETYLGWVYKGGIYLRGDGLLTMETIGVYGSNYQYGIAWAWYREKSKD